MDSLLDLPLNARLEDHSLKLGAVTLRFGGLTALSKVNIEFPFSSKANSSLGVNTIYGIIGPNGAGKSTLFNLITGLYRPTHGEVLYQGHKLHQLKTTQISRLGITRTFQNIRLLPHLNILDNLRVVGAVEREGTFWKSLLKNFEAEKLSQNITERAYQLLEFIGLAHSAKNLPLSLPYGNQRKLEIARALMRKPKLLLLDEPAAGMNPSEKESLMNLILKIQKKGVCILLIEHDMKFVMNLCEHITVLNQGLVCAQGTPSEIQTNPEVIESYLGK